MSPAKECHRGSAERTMFHGLKAPVCGAPSTQARRAAGAAHEGASAGCTCRLARVVWCGAPPTRGQDQVRWLCRWQGVTCRLGPRSAARVLRGRDRGRVFAPPCRPRGSDRRSESRRRRDDRRPRLPGAPQVAWQTRPQARSTNHATCERRSVYVAVHARHAHVTRLTTHERTHTCNDQCVRLGPQQTRVHAWTWRWTHAHTAWLASWQHITRGGRRPVRAPWARRAARPSAASSCSF
jgi:hypothetical protein